MGERGGRRRPAAYDVLLLVFVTCIVWAVLLPGVIPPLAMHASSFGSVGLVALLLIRPRRFGSPPSTRRVVITAAVVCLAATAIELLVGDRRLLLGDSLPLVGASPIRIEFLNTRDVVDAIAGAAAAAVIVLVHQRLTRLGASAPGQPTASPP